jgi:hypothetical protein
VRVLGIEKASFAEDFSFVEVQLRTNQSQGLTLELATDVLKESLFKLWEILHSDRTKSLTESYDTSCSASFFNPFLGCNSSLIVAFQEVF